MNYGPKILLIKTIIICAGFSEKMSRETADALGIKGFPMKPIPMRELAGMIRSILDRVDKND